MNRLSDHIHVVGLTGGIACGKSAVAQLFRELQVAVVDADRVSREVFEPGHPAYQEVVAEFGTAILRDDGTINRRVLGTRVFGDSVALAKLNQITHPRIRARSREIFAELALRGTRWAVYEAALIVENNVHQQLDALVVVWVDEATQLHRLMARDGLSREAALKRIAAQMPLSEKCTAADFVVDNSGRLESTRILVKQVYDELQARFGADHQSQ